MKIKLQGPLPFYSSMRSLFKFKAEQEPPKENLRSRGEGLARLHEYQHRVIVGLFKINIVGIVAFLLIVLSFTLFTLSDPRSPKWIGVMMISVGVLLLLGCYRTVKEFNVYRKNYAELMSQLQAKLSQYFQRGKSKEGDEPDKETESRVLSVLKPREHKGWDSKCCKSCQKTLELLARVCQHCGHEQEDTLRI
ncbi:MAG: hypothetical protein O7A08_01745 [SAR324 cluster bacterium]|nr:hypothetical protein [SAR324 cluster bacterium]